MKKIAPYILLLLLAVAALVMRTCRRAYMSATKRDYQTAQAVNTNRNRGFDRNVNYLEYTRHAKCRMQCRHITQGEVEDMMQHGAINYKKSEVGASPCPTYALEGYTLQDNQHVRIVFAQCDYKTKVVTCIDLNEDFECHCPGDENKHER